MQRESIVALIIAYYLSRFNKKGYENLGYTSIGKAIMEISQLIKTNPNTLRNMRDEYDPYFENDRKGWHQRELRSSRKLVMNQLQHLSEHEMTDIVRDLLNGTEEVRIKPVLQALLQEDERMLRDLGLLCEETKNEYFKNYPNQEVRLSEEFKKEYGAVLRAKKLDSGSIVFYEKTAIITTTANLKIYVPNQWFTLALYAVDYIIELESYKTHINEIIKLLGIEDEKKRNEYIDQFSAAYAQGKTQDFEIKSKEYFVDQKMSDNDANKNTAYIIKFLTDLKWWQGGKQVSRTDYYYSPVLKILNLVHVKQGHVAEIAYEYAKNETLRKLALALIPTVSVQVSTTPHVTAPAKNLIVYGAPGTGKSKFLEDEFRNTKITRVVFHPEYSYYDFVGSYKPVTVYRKDGNTYANQTYTSPGEPSIDYRYVPGPFIKVLTESYLDPDNMHTLLIEEINRANAASVFGELIQLLDREHDGASEYAFCPSEDLSNHLLGIPGMDNHIKDGIRIPANMNIVATMNSADQGVNYLDSAFKRRWEYSFIKIDFSKATHYEYPIHYAGKVVKYGDLIISINSKLKRNQIDEDKLIGPFFIKPLEIERESAIDKLLMYLWDDVLRHKRYGFFSNDISSLSELHERFASNDVFELGEFMAVGASQQSLDEIDANDGTIIEEEKVS